MHDFCVEMSGYPQIISCLQEKFWSGSISNILNIKPLFAK